MEEKSSEGLECERFGEGWSLLIHSMDEDGGTGGWSLTSIPCIQSSSTGNISAGARMIQLTSS